MKILTAYEMRQAEQESARAGISTDTLMENAGEAVAGEVWRILDGEKKNVLLLIGPGNNGGDGLVAARHLYDRGASVSLFFPGKRPEGDPNLEQANERGVPGYGNLDKLSGLLQSADAVVDALFGTGRSRQLSGIYQQALQMVAEAKKKRPGLNIIALDLPSGLDTDTGACDPACLYADNTITLGFLKPGLYSAPGAERAGEITVVDIGIPASAAEGVKTELITDSWARSALPERPPGANKGSFGRVLVVAGSINYPGAAYLACSGAARVGAGLVTLATATSLLPVLASRMAEITYLPLPESSPGIISANAAGIIISELKSRSALLVGCGMGQSEQAASLIKSILLKPESKLPPLVLDADALNILAKTREWWQKLPGDAILTPHPGEMGRLAGITTAEVQADRVGIARKMALEWGKTIVLKGAYTVVAAPDGQCRISPLANPGLASAGTGDVLAGAIVGLLAQGLSLFDAATLGVWLHAGAGEIVKANLGDAGMLASDLLPVLPRVIKELKES